MTKKLLVTIPHFCAPSDSPNNAAANQTAYGSVAGSPARRIQAFQECLDQLARTFAYPAYALDNRTGLIGSAAFILPPEWDVEILICVHEENHLIDSVRLPTQANVIQVGGLPQELGFACHREMASRFQTCDLLCYLEDDIVITDPSFFGKHVWFHKLVNDGAIVQPNRFDVDGDWRKVYVDGPLPKRHVMRYADLKVQSELTAEYGSRRIRFMRPSNLMSAFFF
ncbi:hypothetical protein [Planctomycetes bacterium K23_9]|uniref:Uncharacterized protein n=1 Tax=Stieleria marina TaxID=1930275 RepID=A0A517NP18_9BACT|nr:hypothetical protein K239x_08110 [Planctomycetes bacterium K23_9]